jgi:hypothetical protein
MGNITPLQADFSAGEISPRFLAQENGEIYAKGLARLRNMVPLNQGPTTRRPGTQYIEEITQLGGDPATTGRIFSIHPTNEETLLFVCGGLQGLILTPQSISIRRNLLVNPFFQQGLEPWVDASDPPTGGALSSGTRWEGNQKACELFANYNLYARTRNTVAIDVPQDTVDIEWRVEQAYDKEIPELGDLTGIQVWTDGFQGASLVYVDNAPLQNRGDVYTRRANIQLTPGFTGNLYVEVAVFSAELFKQAVMWLHEVQIIGIGNVADSQQVLVVPWTDEQLPIVQYVSNPYERQTVFVHPEVPPQELVFNTGTNLWELNPIVFIDGPIWTPGSGYPRACGSFQGRLIMGGWTASPQQVIASKPGEWRDLSITSTPVPTDAIDFTLTAVGTIQWIVGQKALLIGTQNGEHQVGSQGGVLQTGDIDIRQMSAYGSRHSQPADVGDQVLYISPDGRKLRAAEVSRDIEGWKSTDLTFASEHITLGGMKHVTYSRDPGSMCWAVLNTGALVGMNYERNLQLYGWHKHETAGSFIDIANMRFGGRDIPFAIASRVVNGVTRIYLEAMIQLDVGEDPEYMDSYIRIDQPAASNFIGGLLHLADNFVQVISEDGYIGEYLVGPQGFVDVSPEIVRNAVCGLKTLAQMETMPLNTASRYGSNMGSLKSRPEIKLRVINSAIPQINGKRPAERDPQSAMNISQPPINPGGDIQQLNLGIDDFAVVNIVQDLPLPLTVLGIFGSGDANDV